MQMAVPVSWHPGKIILDAMFAFLRSSKATNLSFDDASVSFKIFERDFRLEKKLISFNFFILNTNFLLANEMVLINELHLS